MTNLPYHVKIFSLLCLDLSAGLLSVVVLLHYFFNCKVVKLKYFVTHRLLNECYFSRHEINPVIYLRHSSKMNRQLSASSSHFERNVSLPVEL